MDFVVNDMPLQWNPPTKREKKAITNLKNVHSHLCNCTLGIFKKYFYEFSNDQ